MSILLQKKNVGDYSYMSSPNIYYRAKIKSQQERGDTPVGFLQYIVILYVINSNHILFFNEYKTTNF